MTEEQIIYVVRSCVMLAMGLAIGVYIRRKWF